MKTHLLCIFLVSLILYNCRDDDWSAPITDQAIFTESNYIEVPLYSYKDSFTGNSYVFHGTSNDTISITSESSVHVIPYNYYDTVSSRPAFAWKKTKAKNVMVAIFNERVSLGFLNNHIRISNINSIVWAWNTGMSTGQEGAISFNDGCDVRGGIIQYGKSPTPLEKGKDYILAIWAWNDSNLRIEYSSREIPFTVEK